MSNATSDNKAILARKLARLASLLDQESQVVDLAIVGHAFRVHGYEPPRWVTSGCFRCHDVTMDQWCDQRGIARRGTSEGMQPFLARLLRWCVARLEEA